MIFYEVLYNFKEILQTLHSNILIKNAFEYLPFCNLHLFFVSFLIYLRIIYLQCMHF